MISASGLETKVSLSPMLISMLRALYLFSESRIPQQDFGCMEYRYVAICRRTFSTIGQHVSVNQIRKKGQPFLLLESSFFFLIYKKASWIFLNIGTYKLNLNAGTYIGTNLFLLNFGLCENTNGGF